LVSDRKQDEYLQEGLKILMSEFQYFNEVSGKEEKWVIPYICTSPDAGTALTYVEPMFSEGLPEMDLYQVILLDSDRIDLRNDGTNRIIEVRVRNTIPANRVVYLATRE